MTEGISLPIYCGYFVDKARQCFIHADNGSRIDFSSLDGQGLLASYETYLDTKTTKGDNVNAKGKARRKVRSRSKTS